MRNLKLRYLLMAWFGLFVFVFALSARAAADIDPVSPSHEPGQEYTNDDNRVYGSWFYVAKIIDGTRVPEPESATLRLFFEYFPNQGSRLYWYHLGENDWCERRGNYVTRAGHIYDEVTWVNPNNSRQCASDPDMQHGRYTRTRYEIVDGELHLFFQVGEIQLIMVWQKLL